MSKYVVAAGNPFDGMAVHGPFDTVAEAAHWAEREVEDTWWVPRLHAPDEDEEDADNEVDEGE